VVYRIKGASRPETVRYVPPACRFYDEARRTGLAKGEVKRKLRGLSAEAEAEARRWGIWQKEVDFDWYWDEYERFIQTIDVPLRGRC
jgi:hypothetical protein